MSISAATIVEVAARPSATGRGRRTRRRLRLTALLARSRQIEEAQPPGAVVCAGRPTDTRPTPARHDADGIVGREPIELVAWPDTVPIRWCATSTI